MDSPTHFDCNQLQPYLDGKLEADSRVSFERHLKTCDKCTRAVTDWECVKEAYGNWAATRLPEQIDESTPLEAAQFADMVVQKLQADKVIQIQPNRKMKTLSAIAAIAAAVLLIAGIGLWHKRNDTENDIKQEQSVARVQRHSDRIEPAGAIEINMLSFSGNRVTERESTYTPGIMFEATDADRLLMLLEQDTIGLDTGTVIQAEQVDAATTVLNLERGKVACAVSPRTNHNTFVVKTGDITVTVVGTRFLVSVADESTVKVAVVEGKVRVNSDNEEQTLTAGQSSVIENNTFMPLEHIIPDDMKIISKLLSRTPVESPEASRRLKPVSNKSRSARPHALPQKNLAEWRTMILEGNTAQAEMEMQAHLKHAPTDTEIYMLLATCYKKQGAYANAFATYQKVITLQNTGAANRTRYLAGELAQNRLNNHKQAAQLFESYLANSGASSPNRAEATLRLSQSLIQLNQTVRAHSLLQRIIRDYKHTPVARRAQKMIDALKQK